MRLHYKPRGQVDPGSRMSSINGIGTTFIGCDQVRSDGSYITTEWVIVILPIAPTRSLRVWPLGHTNRLVYSSTEYEAQRVPLHWPQVAWMYGTYLIAALFIALAQYVTSPKYEGVIAKPFGACLLAAGLSGIALWMSGFVRQGSVMANLIVHAAIVTFSLVAASHLCAQPERAWQTMYYFWGAYVVYWGYKFFGASSKADA